MRHASPPVKFPLNWRFIAFPLVIIAVADFGLPLFITTSAIIAAQAGEPFKYFDSWETLILADVSLLILGLFLFSRLAQNILTEFTPEGLGQRGILGRKFIPWDQVTVVRTVGLFMHVRSNTKQIAFVWALYNDFRQVANFVREKVPAKTFMQPTK